MRRASQGGTYERRRTDFRSKWPLCVVERGLFARTRAFGLAAAVLFAALTGCRFWNRPLITPVATINQKEALPNPMLIPLNDRELIWNQLVDEVDDYFQIDREQRVQEVGGVLMEGRIETFARTGSTVLEPWRRDSTPGFEKLHATLQSVRRQATIRVIPQANGYLVDVIVRKELEDVDHPERATVGTNTARHDGSLVRNERYRDEGPATLGWITIGRDVSLEQQMLYELRGRLSDLGHHSGKHP